MAKKLYVIGVGGTGSRVLHSLLMMLSSGMPINVGEIVPMIIDTDVNNGNLKKYDSLSLEYSTINDILYSNTDLPTENHFFRTKIRKSVNLGIDGKQFNNIKNLLHYNEIHNFPTKCFIDLLFSKQNLEMPLEKGFVGNPNIGSIVLNFIINESEQFKAFTQEFAEGDRIFIISSIFGGTGAAGFPLLVNNFRYQANINKFEVISNSIIGAVSVLPYFVVAKAEDETDRDLREYSIDSNTFLMRSKAALAYYDNNIKDEVNALYFIADYKRSSFKNQKGGLKQKNPSCFIEFAAANAIVDFMNLEPERNKVQELRQKSNFFEFVIGEDVDDITFKELFDEKGFTSPLIRHHMFRLYYKKFLKDALARRHVKWRIDLGIDENFLTGELGKALTNFYKYYDEWISDFVFSHHTRKFLPFKDQEPTEANFLSLFNGKSPRMNRTILGKERIPTIEFNKVFADQKIPLSGNTEQKFMQVMNTGIESIYKSNFTI